jgi:signal transduction histidine kinase/CheY-like chemotaxis protein
VGGVALAGWMTGSNGLPGILGGEITMKANSAVALVLSGVALGLLQERFAPRMRRLALPMAVLVAAIGFLTLSEHLLGWKLGIDQLLFAEPAGSPATASPNRMGPPASLSFALIGLGLAALDRRTPSGRYPAKLLALAVLLVTLLPLIGYVSGDAQLFGIARYTGIGFATAVTLFVMGGGILLARPKAGLTSILCRRNAAGAIARRLIAPAILFPLLLVWLSRAGWRAGFYDTAFGHSLVVLGFVVVFSMLIWTNATAVDVAERERELAEQERQRLLDNERAARVDAQRANELKDEFLATLSHELRTPLNAIVGWTHVLATGATDAATVERAVAVIGRNAAMQAQLIADILDISRIVAGQLRINLDDVSLPQVIEAALDTVRPAAAAKQIRLETSLDPSVPTIIGDHERLQQVVWNLVSNAIRFAPTGGRVQVRLEAVDSLTRLVVEDDGPGLPAELLPHLFERFRQANASSTRAHQGLGLGLAIVRHLVELHGGSVAGHNRVGRTGAVFSITLPQPGSASPASPPRPALGENRFAGGPAPSLEGIRVLVVDDAADARELVAVCLEQHGARVATAASAQEGLCLLAKQRQDVVLADIEMPDEDGYEFIRRLRLCPPREGGHTPVIAITAHAASKDRLKTLMAGFDLHMSKPLPPAELVTAVARLAQRGDGPR